MRQSKVLITGGNGYIARNLKPMFEQAGYVVSAPSRNELDLLDPTGLENYCIKGFDVVIHAATRGGKRSKNDTFEDVFVPNIKMWENLLDTRGLGAARFILLGSGAEYDRRDHIRYANEDEIFSHWPIDPYGLSKNIITRQANELNNVIVLRLFGCFNWDDDPSRFIKASIINLKKGFPIEVYQDKKMSYFYLDDVFTVMDYVIDHHDVPKNINLTYENRTSLIDIANLIHKYTNIFFDIKLMNMGEGMEYTGDNTLLSKFPIYKNLIGLEEGIRRTVNNVL